MCECECERVSASERLCVYPGARTKRVRVLAFICAHVCIFFMPHRGAASRSTAPQRWLPAARPYGPAYARTRTFTHPHSCALAPPVFPVEAVRAGALRKAHAYNCTNIRTCAFIISAAWCAFSSHLFSIQLRACAVRLRARVRVQCACVSVWVALYEEVAWAPALARGCGRSYSFAIFLMILPMGTWMWCRCGM